MNKIIPIFIFSLMFFGFVSGVVVDDEILKAFNDGADKVNVIVEKSDISNKIKILNNINIKKAIEKKDKFTAYISKEELPSYYDLETGFKRENAGKGILAF